MQRLQKRLRVLSEVLYLKDMCNSEVLSYAYSEEVNIRVLRSKLLPCCHSHKKLATLLTTLCLIGCGNTDFDSVDPITTPTPITTPAPTPIATSTPLPVQNKQTVIRIKKHQSISKALRYEKNRSQQQQQDAKALIW